jgi:hypothetical protein
VCSVIASEASNLPSPAQPDYLQEKFEVIIVDDGGRGHLDSIIEQISGTRIGLPNQLLSFDAAPVVRIGLVRILR